MSDAETDRAIESMAQELRTRLAATTEPARWNAEPEEVRRSVMKLVLTLVDFVRQLMERQALRRVDEGTLTDEEVERLGIALMRLEETIRDLTAQAGLEPADLNIDLGALGKLK